MKLTVVVPCRNEALYIAECIDAIYKCELPTNIDMSVFVVDGMSDDGTREVINELKLKYSTLYLVDNKKELTPFAFNWGIYEGGKVDFVQIVGARHILSQNYLMCCIQRLTENSAIWCVGGRIINEYVNGTGETIAKAMGTSFGMGIGNFRTLSKSGYTDIVTSPMYPYWVFEKIGFFDEELIRNQDDDFNYRVHKEGGKVFYDHDISLKYYVRGNFKGLRRQFYQYGYWKVYVNKKHGGITTMRQLVPPFFVLYLFTVPLAFLFGSNFGLLWLAPTVIHIVLNIIFSTKNAKNSTEFVSLIFTYLMLHISYGLGYLIGLIQFMILNRKPSQNQKRMSR